MKFTKNYHLPQWVEDDLILMDDFNTMNQNIEDGIDGAKAEARAAAEELDRRVSAADVKASAKPYAMGLYAGIGTADQEITVGFKPSFLLIFTNQTADDPTLTIARFCAVSSDVNTAKVKFTDTGFRVMQDIGSKYPYVNYKGMLYQYIAFK